MSKPPQQQAFLPYRNNQTGEITLVLELTQPLLNLLRATPELVHLANISQPGDFVVGFEGSARIEPKHQFLREYTEILPQGHE